MARRAMRVLRRKAATLHADAAAALGLADFHHLVGAWRLLDGMEERTVRMAEVLHQRASLQDAPDWHLGVDHTDSVIEMRKFHSAIDAVLMGFIHDIFGEAWIVEQERRQLPWLPLLTVGSCYEVTRADEGFPFPDMPHFAAVPRADVFRSRFWPTLAHEVAHARIHWFERHASDTDKSKYAFAKRGICEAIQREVLGPLAEQTLPSDAPGRAAFAGANPGSACPAPTVAPIGTIEGLEWVPEQFKWNLTSWAVEFVCDAVGIYVAGPAFLLSLVTLNGPDAPVVMVGDASAHDEGLQRPDVQAFLALRRTHPPKAVRRAVARELLSLMYCGDWRDKAELDVFDRAEESLAAAEKNDTWLRCVRAWVEAAPSIARRALDAAHALLPPRTERFSREMLAEAMDMVDRFAPDGATRPASAPSIEPLLAPSGFDAQPRIVLNAGWQKRLMSAEAVRELRGTPAFNNIERLTRDAHHPVGELFGGIVSVLNKYLRERWAEYRRLAGTR